MPNANKRLLVGAALLVAFVGCATYREATPVTTAEPPKVYDRKSPDEMRDQDASDETEEDADEKKSSESEGGESAE